MSEAWQSDDEALLAALRSAVGSASDVPPEVITAAKGAYAWRTIDEELAALTYDSVLDERHAALVRGPDTSRMLTFEGASVSVEVGIEGDHLVGQLLPPSAAEIEVQAADGTTTRTCADEAGCFVVARPAARPLRLRCELADGSSVVTAWLPL